MKRKARNDDDNDDDEDLAPYKTPTARAQYLEGALNCAADLVEGGDALTANELLERVKTLADMPASIRVLARNRFKRSKTFLAALLSAREPVPRVYELFSVDVARAIADTRSSSWCLVRARFLASRCHAYALAEALCKWSARDTLLATFVRDAAHEIPRALVEHLMRTDSLHVLSPRDAEQDSPTGHHAACALFELVARSRHDAFYVRVLDHWQRSRQGVTMTYNATVFALAIGAADAARTLRGCTARVAQPRGACARCYARHATDVPVPSLEAMAVEPAAFVYMDARMHSDRPLAAALERAGGDAPALLRVRNAQYVAVDERPALLERALVDAEPATLELVREFVQATGNDRRCTAVACASRTYALHVTSSNAGHLPVATVAPLVAAHGDVVRARLAEHTNLWHVDCLTALVDAGALDASTAFARAIGALPTVPLLRWALGNKDIVTSSATRVKLLPLLLQLESYELRLGAIRFTPDEIAAGLLETPPRPAARRDALLHSLLVHHTLVPDTPPSFATLLRLFGAAPPVFSAYLGRVPLPPLPDATARLRLFAAAGRNYRTPRALELLHARYTHAGDAE